MNSLKLIAAALSMFLAIEGRADILIGSGFSASHGGRQVPTLYGGFNVASFGMSVTSVGTHSTRHYHSAWQVNFFRVYNPGEFIWGKVQAGLGLGAHFYRMGYMRSADTPVAEQGDFALGPAIRMHWSFAGPLFIGIEAMFGIRGFEFIYLSTQDVVNLNVGLRF